MGGRANIIRAGEGRRIITPNVLTMPRRIEEAPPVLDEGPIFLSPWFYDSVGQGTWIIGAYDALNIRGSWLANSSNANGDNVSYKAYMAAGTYTLKVVAVTSPEQGIVDYKIDGVEVASFDWYSAGTIRNVIKTQGFVIAEAGVKTIQVIINGKNGSSIGYYHGPYEFVFYRVPDIPAGNLWAWYKPEDLEGYENNETVTLWVDALGESARNLDFINLTPHCLTDFLNGYNAVVCDSQETLSNNGETTPTSPTMTIFSVCRVAGGPAPQRNWLPGAVDGSVVNRGMAITTVQTAGEFDWEVRKNPGPILAVDGPGVYNIFYILVARHKTDLTELWVNGINKPLTNSTFNYTPCNPTGDYIFLGGNGAHPHQVVAEFGVYDAALSDLEISDLMSYLNNKFQVY